jgi:hypothetical protein
MSRISRRYNRPAVVAFTGTTRLRRTVVSATASSESPVERSRGITLGIKEVTGVEEIPKPESIAMVALSPRWKRWGREVRLENAHCGRG